MKSPALTNKAFFLIVASLLTTTPSQASHEEDIFRNKNKIFNNVTVANNLDANNLTANKIHVLNGGSIEGELNVIGQLLVNGLPALGPRGPQGASGPQGDTGSQGPAGATGATGPTGLGFGYIYNTGSQPAFAIDGTVDLAITGTYSTSDFTIPGANNISVTPANGASYGIYLIQFSVLGTVATSAPTSKIVIGVSLNGATPAAGSIFASNTVASGVTACVTGQVILPITGTTTISLRYVGSTAGDTLTLTAATDPATTAIINASLTVIQIQ